MWVDGGIHAREWISPAVNTFLLRELVENDAAHPEFTQELDWCEFNKNRLYNKLIITGISYPWSTLMATDTPGALSDTGGRHGQRMSHGYENYLDLSVI